MSSGYIDCCRLIKVDHFILISSNQHLTNEKRASASIAKTLYITGTPDRIRTCDLRIRSPLLYPAELQARTLLVYNISLQGFEDNARRRLL